jgi:hypothetical protein
MTRTFDTDLGKADGYPSPQFQLKLFFCLSLVNRRRLATRPISLPFKNTRRRSKKSMAYCSSHLQRDGHFVAILEYSTTSPSWTGSVLRRSYVFGYLRTGNSEN